MPFMSAFKEGATAVRFVEKSNYPVLIMISKNATGRDVEPIARQISRFGSQKELLYKKGSKFSVDEVGKSDVLGKTCYTIQLSEIP